MRWAAAVLAAAVAFLLGWALGRLERDTPEIPWDWPDEIDADG